MTIIKQYLNLRLRKKLIYMDLDLSNKYINNLGNVNKQNFPHAFLNHLIFKNKTNLNNSNANNNLQISLTKRVKAKNLTILYYRPYL